MASVVTCVGMCISIFQLNASIWYHFFIRQHLQYFERNHTRGLYKYAICSVTALTQVISGHSKPTNQLLQAYLYIFTKQKDTTSRVLTGYLIRTDVPTYCDQFAAVIPGLS